MDPSEPGSLMAITEFRGQVRCIVVDFAVGRERSHGTSATWATTR